MPTISNFYGIAIKMFFRNKEHNPPHIHAIYGEYVSEIDVRNGVVLVGDLPDKALSLVKEWVKLHKNELIEMWETQNFSKLPPLI
jgi:hypothetical protein